MPVKKDIIYPIFLECCQYANDNFWKNIFEDLAYGKTPYGTYITKNFLCCGYKDKEFSYKIERKNHKKIYNDIYNLLTKKLGILSYQEKINKRAKFHLTEGRIRESRQSWTHIKKKNVKDLLIERYVVDMKNKYKLTIKQSKFLLSIIFISIVFKVISNKDIDYYDGKIHNIEGIEFSKEGEIIVKKKIYNLEATFLPNSIDDRKKLSNNWDKYLESLRKINIKNKTLK